MSSFWSLLRVELGPHHHSPGKTKHRLKDEFGLRDFPPFIALEIVQVDTESAFYLMYIPKSGPGTDTFHLSLDDAKHQAEWEFGVAENEWVKTERPF
jgi:hypothetical protein